jgi:hypothetical protein
MQWYGLKGSDMKAIHPAEELFLDQFRKLWNGDTYNNLPFDTILTSSLKLKENGEEVTYFEDKPEPGLFEMCFTVRGIKKQLDNLKYKVGIIYYFNPIKMGIQSMPVEKIT